MCAGIATVPFKVTVSWKKLSGLILPQRRKIVKEKIKVHPEPAHQGNFPGLSYRGDDISLNLTNR